MIGDTPFSATDIDEVRRGESPVQSVWEFGHLQGTTFTLRQNSCSGSVVPFTDAGKGSQAVLVNIGKTFYFTAATGFPAGTVLNWYNLQPGGIWSVLSTTNRIPWQYDTSDVALEVVVPSTAASGTYKVSVTVAQDISGTASSTLNWNITVVPTPKLTPLSPTSIPDIPGLSGWQTTMTSSNGGGLQWCAHPDNPTQIFSFGVDSQVWYYDGARVYFQIGDYTGDTSWYNCAHNIASQYADYVLSGNGQTPGWRVFPHGLARASQMYPTEAKFLPSTRCSTPERLRHLEAGPMTI